MLLVTGATGNVGGELVRSQAQGVLPASVETVPGDLNQPESLSAALTDVRGVFLLSGYQDMPGVLAEYVDAFFSFFADGTYAPTALTARGRTGHAHREV